MTTVLYSSDYHLVVRVSLRGVGRGAGGGGFATLFRAPRHFTQLSSQFRPAIQGWVCFSMLYYYILLLLKQILH